MNYTITDMRPDVGEVVKKVHDRVIRFKIDTSRKFANKVSKLRERHKSVIKLPDKPTAKLTDLKTGLDIAIVDVDSIIHRLEKMFNMSIKTQNYPLVSKQIGRKALKVKAVTVKGTERLKKGIKSRNINQDLNVNEVKPVIQTVVPKADSNVTPNVIDLPKIQRLSDELVTRKPYGGESPSVSLPLMDDKKDMSRPMPNNLNDDLLKKPLNDYLIGDNLNKLEEEINELKNQSQQLQEETAKKALELRIKRDEIDKTRMKELKMEAEILRRNILESQRQRDELEKQIQSLDAKNPSEDNFSRRVA